MLRRTRIFVILFFLVSVAVWKGYDVLNSLRTDRSLPVITMTSDSVTISVKDGDAAILNGVTAEDAGDGDLTEKIFIENRKHFIEKGKFTVTFAVADSDNHVARATREVIYSDYLSPQFELSEPLDFPKAMSSQDDVDIAANLSAHDVLDGNISNKIRISGEYTLSTHSAGEYPMEFIVMNNMGDTTTLPVTVKIYDPTEVNSLPKIRLRNYLVNISAGSWIDLDDMIERIEYHGMTYTRGEDGAFHSGEYDRNGEEIRIPAEYVTRTGDVDFNDPGVYEVKYIYNNSEEEIMNDTRLYVAVYD